MVASGLKKGGLYCSFRGGLLHSHEGGMQNRRRVVKERLDIFDCRLQRRIFP